MKKSPNMPLTVNEAKKFAPYLNPRQLGEKALVLTAAGIAAASLVGSVSAAENKDNPATTNGHEATPDAIVNSVMTKNRAVYINGKPAFLFGVWAPKDTWSVDNLGANLLIDYSGNTSESQLSQLSQGRFWQLVRARPGMTLGPRLSNEIGVAWEDEPESHNKSAQALASTPQDGLLNYQNYTEDFVRGGMVNSAASRNRYKPYLDNLGRNAAVGFDIYNMTSPQDNPGWQYHYTLGAKWNTQNDTPVVAYINTAPQPGSLQTEVTPQDVVAEAKAAITGGSTWINWWERINENQPNATAPDVAEAIKSFTTEVHGKLSDILLAPQMKDKNNGLASAWEDPIKIGGRVVTNKNGLTTDYVIAFNSGREPISTLNIRQKLPGLTNQKVEEVISGKTLIAKNGKVKYAIASEDWVIISYIPKTLAKIKQ